MVQNTVVESTDIDPSAIESTMEIAKSAAYEAGHYLVEKLGQVHVVSKKAKRDDLLDVDLKAEEIIINKLRENFPDYGILSEEAGSENKNAPYQWVIDPLDGSYNFQHGNPTFAISISLVLNKVTRISVVYLPLQQEMFTACLGRGAYLNDKPIRVSETSNLDSSIIHVGDFAKDGNIRENKELLKDIAHLANTVGRVRMIGTAATDLAYVACGRAEALVVQNALPWDIEVGCLLVSEAGGKIYRSPEAKSGRCLVVCTNESIHKQLLDVIRKRNYFEKKVYMPSIQNLREKIVATLKQRKFLILV